MADAYGSILMTVSEDAVIDQEGLVDALNKYQDWSNEGGEWKIVQSDEKQIIIYDIDGNYQVQYPSVGLTRVVSLLVDREDGKVKVSVADVTDDDWEQMVGEEVEEISLEEISKEFSPFVKSGWFEITCCSHEKMRSADFQRLRVEASGGVRREVMYSDMFGRSVSDFEVFNVK
jgi:hypothetical protein